MLQEEKIWCAKNRSNGDNYTYDDVGQLIADKSEEIANIEWTMNGKIKKVTRTAASIQPDLEFGYDASDCRVFKSVKNKGGSVGHTYYFRDSQGLLLSIYENNGGAVVLKEQPIYGCEKIGTSTPLNSFSENHIIGQKEYELVDHLENVHVVLSDINSKVVAAIDYYPFGMVSRSYSSNYRYGYNKGSEKDDEISGEGNNYTTLNRELDTRLGRWWTCDPEDQENPDHSPYCSMGNSPIQYNDPNGDIFGIDNLIGMGVGILLEVGTQVAVNAISGNDLLDLDYADIAVEAAVGFATSGVGNVMKVGKTAAKVATAAKTAEKVVATNKAVKTAVKVTTTVVKATGKQAVKAAVDIKKDGVAVVGGKKTLAKAGTDFVAGVAGDGVAKVVGGVVTKGTVKAATTATKTAAKATTGSAKQVAATVRATNATINTNVNKKVIEKIADVGSGVAAEKAKQKLK